MSEMVSHSCCKHSTVLATWRIWLVWQSYTQGHWRGRWVSMTELSDQMPVLCNRSLVLPVTVAWLESSRKMKSHCKESTEWASSEAERLLENWFQPISICRCGNSVTRRTCSKLRLDQALCLWKSENKIALQGGGIFQFICSVFRPFKFCWEMVVLVLQWRSHWMMGPSESMK